MTSLRARMIQDMKLRRLSENTQRAYLRCISGLAQHYNRSPDRIGGEDIKAYLLHLTEVRKLAWKSCVVVSSAIRYFYSAVLQVDTARISIPPCKGERRLPAIYSHEEVERLLTSASTPKAKALLMTTYGGGLRASEVTHLKVADIDSSRMMIRVCQGKGRKDRYTILSKRLLEELRSYWKMYRPEGWLFQGGIPGRPMTRESAHRAFVTAKRRAGIQKQGGIHTLRHCFATHLLEADVDLYTIKELLGHSSIRTTMGYLSLTRKMVNKLKSPLDLIDLPVAPTKR